MPRDKIETVRVCTDIEEIDHPEGVADFVLTAYY